MHRLMQYFPAFSRYCNRTFVVVVIAFAISGDGALYGQAINRITGDVNAAELVTLPNHHPQWANKENAAGLLPSGTSLQGLTLVLSRSPEQERSYRSFWPNSRNLLRRITITGSRLQRWENASGSPSMTWPTLSIWLQSQGLHVNWVSPSRMFIGFGGAAAALGRAFHTQLLTYHASGVQRMAPSSDPMIPRALAPAIKAVQGLYSLEDKPLHSFRLMQSISPDVSTSSGEHFITPGDFAAIYGGGSTSGVTIGIVGRSRTDFNDFENFRQQTETNFPNPTEIVPTAFGGVDPGPAYTAPPATSVSLDDQSEATLDVMRAGSVAGAAPDSAGGGDHGERWSRSRRAVPGGNFAPARLRDEHQFWRLRGVGWSRWGRFLGHLISTGCCRRNIGSGFLRRLGRRGLRPGLHHPTGIAVAQQP